MNFKKVYALGLCSGGLDSRLAAVVLQRQGIDVRWIAFETPFFSSAEARDAAKSLEIPLTVKNITEVYLKMLKDPPNGYGRHMNPCMDCHALMFKIAGKIMEEKGYDFLFSGEILGQRPMSQTKPSLRYVEKHSGYDGYILRPLSAKKLPETIPEKEGKVNRNMLLDISGRSRKPQIELARQFGIFNYPSPAGGCLLTDKRFSVRLKDLFEHQKYYTESELHLLKYGRHIRLNKNTKIIVGRNQDDNKSIIRYYNPASDIIIKVKKIPGPTVLATKGTREDILQAASICAGYSKANRETKIDVNVTTDSGCETVQVTGTSPAQIKNLII